MDTLQKKKKKGKENDVSAKRRSTAYNWIEPQRMFPQGNWWNVISHDETLAEDGE